MNIIKEELAKRDPINESDVLLTNPMKEVARLSKKFCPMPRGPVDTYDMFWSFERFARNLRWAWFHFVQQKNMEVESDDDDNDIIEDDFVMVPWYRRTDRNPPKGNAQLEAGLYRLKDYLFDPANRRKVKENKSIEQRRAMGQLRNLPNTSNAQVAFEDKGSRFVIRNLDYQDQLMLDQLTDANHFDELQ